MVRELKKPRTGIEELGEFEKITDLEVSDIENQRKKDFESELNTGYYFCVVFDTAEERDRWLKSHKLKLTEDTFIKASDFIL